MLADEDGNNSDLFDFLISNGTLDAAYKKILNSIHKTHIKKMYA